VESNWVHSAHRPPIALLYLPRVIMRMENLVERWLTGETEVFRENLLQCHFVHHKSQMTRPGVSQGRRGRKPATNHLSYGTANNNSDITITWRWYFLTNSMEQSSLQDTTSSSASQIPQLRDPERSLLWSQELALVPILKTNTFWVFIFCFLKTNFNIFLPFTLWSLHWPLPLTVFYYNVCIFHLPCVLLAPFISSSFIWHPNNN
jgi:hypothetical protein